MVAFMLLAGFSEFFLLAALAVAATKVPQDTHKLIQVGYLAALSLTALSALCGAIRYLDLGDSLVWHQTLTFYSKHLGMPIFVIMALWPNLRSYKTRALAAGFVALSLISCLINLAYSLSVLSDGLMVSVLLFTAYSLRQDRQTASFILLALSLLLSTLLWGAIITDESLRIGVFHMCLGGYFIVLASSLNRTNSRQHTQVASI